MDNTLNDTGSERRKEDLKAWMENHPQEYGEMAKGMGEATEWLTTLKRLLSTAVR